MSQSEWVLVPKTPTQEMLGAGFREACHIDIFPAKRVWDAMLSAAPPEPHTRFTAEQAASAQHWAGMDGVIAWHLIDRHANGWADIGRMMDAWLEANKGTK